MSMRVRAATIAAGMILLAGCSETSESEGRNETSTIAAPSNDQGTVVDVSIENGVVTPTNPQVEATVGEEITIRIHSDIDDELHVHSVPNHTFAVSANSGTQVFIFVIDVPGRAALELHENNKTVATLLVRP